MTGGAGFIGSNIVRRLLEDGHRVRILDNFSTGRRKNIEGFGKRIEIIEAEITDLGSVKKAMAGVDYCLHQAALPSVERSIKEPTRVSEVNIRGTLNVLVAAREAKVKRVIYASSSSIYGGGNKKPGQEKSEQISSIREDSPPNPLSPYATTKLVGEHYGRLFTRLYGLEVITLRYFNVFGPGQDPDSEYAAVIPKFIKAALRNESPTIYGDGGQSRDFTYVDNVVEANILAVQAKGKVAGENFNIAAGKNITINKLWSLISKLTKKEIKPFLAPSRLGEVRHSLADISRARERLGYSLKVDFETGLARTIEYLK